MTDKDSKKNSYNPARDASGGAGGRSASNSAFSNGATNGAEGAEKNAARDGAVFKGGKSPQEKFRTAMTWGVGAFAVIGVLSIILWSLVLGMPGFWGAVIGVAFGGGFVLVTLVSFVVTMNKDANVMATVVLGGWLLKMLVAILVCAGLRHATFMDPKAFAITVVLALVFILPAEVKATL